MAYNTVTMSDPSPRTPWYYNVWFVLLMLFVVLGPFGLPLVWKHPRFSRRTKTWLTIVTIGYTAWLITATVSVVRTTMRVLHQLPAGAW